MTLSITILNINDTGATSRNTINANFASILASYPASAVLAGLTDIQTFTNKTLTAPVINNPTINVGGDATGDIYYRNSGGIFTRLAPGSNGQYLSLLSGLPAWATLSSANGLYWIDSGSTNTIVVTPSPTVGSYTAGLTLEIKVAVTNTGAVTINANGLGAQALKKGNGTTALVAGDLVAGQIIKVEYDGTNFQLLTPSALALNSNGSAASLTNVPNGVTYKSGTTTKNATDASQTQNIPHGLGGVPKYVKITAMLNDVNTNGTGPSFLLSTTVYNGTTQSSMSLLKGSSIASSISTSFILNGSTTGASDNNTGVVTFDATNIIITWTKNGSPASLTYTLLWEAQG